MCSSESPAEAANAPIRCSSRPANTHRSREPPRCAGAISQMLVPGSRQTVRKFLDQQAKNCFTDPIVRASVTWKCPLVQRQPAFRSFNEQQGGFVVA